LEFFLRDNTDRSSYLDNGSSEEDKDKTVVNPQVDKDEPIESPINLNSKSKKSQEIKHSEEIDEIEKSEDEIKDDEKFQPIEQENKIQKKINNLKKKKIIKIYKKMK